MLASIHPLGERARGNRWGLTFSAYLLASTIAGGLLGGLLGLVGAMVGSAIGTATGAPLLLLVAAIALAAALVFDLGIGNSPLPSVRRQVDRAWLDRYRGWVYGVGFGFQLGLGVATIVTTAAVYLTLVLAFVSTSGTTGMVIGATFGAPRAATLAAAAKVRDPAQLRALYRSLDRWRPPVQGLVVGTELLAAGAVIMALVGS
jgi:hypothetical protein